MIEAWRKVWRDGIAPQLSTAGLQALATALVNDDPQLLQGVTTSPPPLESMKRYPVEGACPIAFAGWKGAGLWTVGDVEEAFGQICFAADFALGEPAAIRYFLNWADDADRATLRAELLAEVQAELTSRRSAPLPAA